MLHGAVKKVEEKSKVEGGKYLRMDWIDDE
jgi:hypothetical protein